MFVYIKLCFSTKNYRPAGDNWVCIACVDPEGDRGSPPPLKNHKNLGFPSNTGPDPLKDHKATKPAFNVGPTSARQQNAI